MGNFIEQPGILLGIKALDFLDKDTKQPVQGLKIVLARPAKQPEYDGWGYVPFDLKDMSLEGLARARELAAGAANFFMTDVVVQCAVDLSGRFPRYQPRSIIPA